MADLKEFDFPNFRNSSFRLDKPSQYLISKARKDEINGYSNLKKSMTSSTIYIGKLSFTTTEEQLFDIFSKCGEISKIIMGLDKIKLTPTGFCFIIFAKPESALASLKYLNKTNVNGKSIDIDLDPGFEEGRQYGRGSNGAQKVHHMMNNNSNGGGGNYQRSNNYRHNNYGRGSKYERSAGGPGYRNNRRFEGGNNNNRHFNRYNNSNTGNEIVNNSENSSRYQNRNFRERRERDSNNGNGNGTYRKRPRRDGTQVWRPSDDPEYLAQSGGDGYNSYQPQGQGQAQQQQQYNNDNNYYQSQQQQQYGNDGYSDNYYQQGQQGQGQNYDNGYNNNYNGNYNNNNNRYDDNSYHGGNVSGSGTGGANENDYYNENNELPPHLQNNNDQLPPHLQ
ncbi:unnamed protein product [[Candida] boidinii]|nr:hypothetical protein BVG19_g1939 [[Candida] boidinii]OWB51608.1 hypothetical protein B5S27_g3173 [[Candida] boidinii]OWB83719.1 hypothetical protein B5S33_g2350 [[Candida] boidinii]GMF04970.1 unnamed protein product [[Candida] boidinii]